MISKPVIIVPSKKRRKSELSNFIENCSNTMTKLDPTKKIQDTYRQFLVVNLTRSMFFNKILQKWREMIKWNSISADYLSGETLKGMESFTKRIKVRVRSKFQLQVFQDHQRSFTSEGLVGNPILSRGNVQVAKCLPSSHQPSNRPCHSCLLWWQTSEVFPPCGWKSLRFSSFLLGHSQKQIFSNSSNEPKLTVLKTFSISMVWFSAMAL